MLLLSLHDDDAVLLAELLSQLDRGDDAADTAAEHEDGLVFHVVAP